PPGCATPPARECGPTLVTWFAGGGTMAMSGGREIPYFIVPIVAPVIGACAGAAIYRYFIGKNLPCNRCEL
ncbi:propanediol diffusion facilitator PduF, partial [Salmonella enterica subsp. enterica serovar Poona]